MAANKTEQLQIRIGPSILNANLARLADECTKLLDASADYLHLDVMDGQFVPNLTFGHPVVKCLRKELGPKPYFDMHMMVAQPEQWIEDMADAGANLYTFHVEATQDIDKCIRKVRDAGMKVGLALRPGTPVDIVLPFVEQVDMVLVMTVEPGFGGQKFMGHMMAKVERLRQQFQHLDIEVDGGVGPNTIDACASAGANMIVSGSAVINSPDQRQVITLMRDRVAQALVTRAKST
ncbi:Ribulose-phosphate 3-epimerase [Halotydeus destructor]|nr:Ribulose-phosphate 3-epimerase [Halotydeus destructor]